MLVLPIKKKWFDMIATGEKKEEYRDIKPYWNKRFLGMNDINFTISDRELKTLSVIFRNGYRKNIPILKCKCALRIGYGNKVWGAEPNTLYYILKILKVEEL